MMAAMQTTRRMLFAAAPAAAVAAPALGAMAEPSRQTDFVRNMEGIFPGCGGRAALRALEAGMRPSDLAHILGPCGRNRDPDWWPALMFECADGEYRTFRPRGEGP